MQRLLEEFDAVFDLRQRLGDASLGELIEQTVTGVEGLTSLEDLGTSGSFDKRASESKGFVSFNYRPHLFPGMDVKLRLAHELQFQLLPRDLPPQAPVSIAAVLESYCHLSGDLFGWEMLKDGKFLIWIVDIAGHGVRAGLASAMLRTLIDNLEERSDLPRLLHELNLVLHDSIRPEHYGLYATAFMMALGNDGQVSYCSAGHPPILVRRQGGAIEELSSLDVPVGLFPGTRFQSRDLRLAPHDRLLLYTDGLIEATGHDGEPFGLDRLRELFRATDAAPERITAAIYEEATRRQDINKLEDDVTFVALEFQGAS